MDRSDVSELVDDPVRAPESFGEWRAWREVERTLLDEWVLESDVDR